MACVLKFITIIEDKNHHKTVSDRITASSVSWNSKEAGFLYQKFRFQQHQFCLKNNGHFEYRNL